MSIDMTERDFTKQFNQRLEKDLRREEGGFVLHFGTTRRAPSVFNEVAPDNTPLLRYFYSRTYEHSLNQYLKNNFHLIDRSALDFLRLYDTAVEFLFGNDLHRGVYPIVLTNFIERFGVVDDVIKVISAAEALYLKGYRVERMQGEYYLVDAAYDVVAQLERTPGAPKIVSYDYLEEVKRLMKIAGKSDLTPIERAALTSFEIPSTAEKEQFSVPTGDATYLVRLDELPEIDSYRVVGAKMQEGHSVAVFRGAQSVAFNLSFIGNQYRNYYWLVTDLAETRMLDDLARSHGFLYVKNLTSKYIIDADGYLVSKFLPVYNDILFDVTQVYPLGMTSAARWLDDLPSEGKKQLSREMSTYILLELALGNDSLDQTSFKVEPNTRTIYNSYCSFQGVLSSLRYLRGVNNEVTLDVSKHMTNALDMPQLTAIVKRVRKDGSLPSTQATSFGFGRDLRIIDNLSVVEGSDRVSLSGLHSGIFLNEAGNFYASGEKLVSHEEEIYTNWFTRHLVNAGMPEFCDAYITLANRYALFSLLTYAYQGGVL